MVRGFIDVHSRNGLKSYQQTKGRPVDPPRRTAVVGLPDIEALRERIALACRVLAVTGLVEHILGHISARTGPDSLLVRGRGPAERGLAFTVVDDVQEVPLDGSGEVPADWSTPGELPIHTEVLR